MNELIGPQDEQRAIKTAEHISRPLEDGDEVFALDEANTIVLDKMFPGYDLKTHALAEHTKSGVYYSDIMAHALGVGELSRERVLRILLVDHLGAKTAKLLEEKVRNKESS